ncbi:DUF3426 domain-containing protein [Rhodoferax sp.]|uniref:DUF3426 domain-containing protein n=1 Tax=Rhodoferax sp. TaxID=50421 RepID=UPI00374CFABD
MALITRCPVCGTLFKVVPDQLRISEGWVRCGHCAEIFDASGDLQQSDLENQPIQPLVEAPVQVDVYVPAPEPEPEWLTAPEPNLQIPAEEFQSALPDVSGAVWDLPPPLPLAQDHAPVSSPEPVQELASVVDLAEIQEQPDPERVAAVEEIPSDSVFQVTEPALETAASDYSFVSTPVASATGHRLWVRWLWGAAAGVLLVLLGSQAVVAERDRIAAMWPAVKPGLQAICAPLGCAVQAWRQIDSVVIDSSTLGTVQSGDAYRLNLVLKNLAAVDLAMPAIEFVLTDIEEQAVFRRVLTPLELGAASRVLFAGREWSTSVELRVTDNPNKARIVGYRLLAFYP